MRRSELFAIVSFFLLLGGTFYRAGVLPTLLFASFGIIVYLVYVLIDEDRSAWWRARYYQAKEKITGRLEDEKKFISNDITSKLNLARRDLHFAETMLPEAVNVDWITEGEAEVGTYTISDGEFVIRLDPKEDQERNIITLAELLIKRTTLAPIRAVIPPELKRALDLTLIKKLLHSVGHDPSVNTFHYELYSPLLESNPDLKEWNDKVAEIDTQGLYETLLMVELEEFGRNVAGLDRRPWMIGEITGFVDFVYDFATRREGQTGRLKYERAFISAGIVPVAKLDKIVEKGISPYVEAVDILISEPVQAIYLLIWDKSYLRGANPAKWLKYRRATRQLVSALSHRADLEQLFSAKYSNLDQDGNWQKGEVRRFRVDSG